jgi:uncharacterized protein YdeI (YjbR/CyaY-like superfamily)
MRFQVELEHAAGPLRNWTVVYMPFDARSEFGSGGIIRVRGTINGFAFNTSIFPSSQKGRHFLMVNKKMLKGARVSAPGEVVEITLEQDAAPNKVSVPAALRSALNANAEARKCFDELPPGSQRYRVEVVTDAKSPAMRERRIKDLVINMAELGRTFKQIPDFMDRALAKSPAAQIKFKALSVSHRREFLIYVLHGKSQATRERRTAVMIKKLLEKGHF